MKLKKTTKTFSADTIHASYIFFLASAVYMLSYAGICYSFDEVGYAKSAQSSELLHSILIALQTNNWHYIVNERLPFVISLAFINKLIIGLHIGIGPLQAMYLINIVSTSITGAFVFLIGRELHYSKRTSTIVSLIFAFASPSWVYSKSLFRDSFAAMWLSIGFYYLIRSRVKRSLTSLGISVLFFMLAVLTRSSTAAVVPFVSIYAMISIRTTIKNTLSKSTAVLLSLLGVILLVIGSSITIFVEKEYLGYLHSLFFVLHTNSALWKNMAAITISPQSGLLFYYPAVSLSIIGAITFAKRHPWESVVIYLSAGGYLVALSHYSMWWGGINWGPRFLIAFIPYLTLPMLPLIDSLHSSSKTFQTKISKYLIPIFILILVFSLIIQIVGVTIGTSTLIYKPKQAYITTAFKIKYAPIVWQFMNKYNLQHINSDIAWLHFRGIFPVLIVILFFDCTAITYSLMKLFHSLTNDISWKQSRQPLLMLLMGGIIFTMFTLQEYYKNDARYKTKEGYPQALAFVKNNWRNSDVMIIDTPLSDHLITWARLLNFRFCEKGCPSTFVIGREVWARDNELQRKVWMQRILNGKKRAWLIPTGLPPGSLQSQVEQWMDARYFKQGCKWTGKTIRVCLYFLPSPDYRDKVLMRNISFGDQIELQQITLSTKSGELNNTDTIIRNPGTPLLITFRWRLIKHVSKNYKFTLQLLGSDGKLYAQKDETIGEPFKPISTWRLDEVETERYALVLPTRMKKDVYTLLLGVYASQSGDRLIPKGPSNIFTLDHLVKTSTVTINTGR